MNNNILFCSAGRRGRLLIDAKQTMQEQGKIVAVDNNSTAPALYFADTRYTVPRIDSPEYLDKIMNICNKEQIKAITTLIDPEIEFLAKNRQKFLEQGILPLCPTEKTAQLCFDKYKMFKYLSRKGIKTTLTYNNLEDFQEGLNTGKISFPVFIKPISGSGSVGAHKVNSMEELLSDWNSSEFNYIIQELMTEGDCDADVYVDCFSHKPVAMFSKRKIETRIGGASKTISFKDEKLFNFIEQVCGALELNGPCDMDFFTKNGEYYLSEINPRLGGAYIHAYGAGVDFIKLILNNIRGKENKSVIGNYEEDVVMMMYDDVVIKRKSDLALDI